MEKKEDIFEVFQHCVAASKKEEQHFLALFFCAEEKRSFLAFAAVAAAAAAAEMEKKARNQRGETLALSNFSGKWGKKTKKVCHDLLLGLFFLLLLPPVGFHVSCMAFSKASLLARCFFHLLSSPAAAAAVLDQKRREEKNLRS